MTGAGERRNADLPFYGYKEKVLEMDSGDICTASEMYLRPLNHTLKND